MKAIQYNPTIPRYVFGLLAEKVSSALLWSGLSCTAFKELPRPNLPDDEWVLIKTIYGGICGSDISAVFLKTSPYTTALTSFPLILGHENVGRIAAVGPQAKEWEVGERVVVDPTLWCRPRGFEDLCCFCEAGETMRCERYTDGVVSAGLMIGFCRDTGGSWGEYFVAHKSQLYRVPEVVNDENALLVEPLAVGMHAALQNFPQEEEVVLIVGAGAIGLCTLASLRVLNSKTRILVLARYSFQAEAAQRLGASQVISVGRGNDYYSELAAYLNVRLFKPMIGKRVMVGGVDKTFECSGHDSALDDAIRLTRNGGRVVPLGLQGITKGVDFTPAFLHEIELRPSYLYDANESFYGEKRSTYEVVLELLTQECLDLSWLVTHKFKLKEYGKALQAASNVRKSKAIKVVFAFNDE